MGEVRFEVRDGRGRKGTEGRGRQEKRGKKRKDLLIREEGEGQVGPGGDTLGGDWQDSVQQEQKKKVPYPCL